MFSIARLFNYFIPKTLFIRFILIITLPMLIGQLIAIHIFYERHWYNVLQRTSDLIVQEIDSLVNHDNYQQQPNINHHYLNLTYRYYPNRGIPITMQKPVEEALLIFQNALSGIINYPSAVVIDPLGRTELFLQIDRDLIHITLPYKSLINPSTHIFISWILFLTILLLTVSLIFSKNQLRSILELTKAAENYGQGRKMDYKPSGAQEIRNAGLAFLKMKARLEKQSSRRTQMLAMISHDLRTPLTRMKLQVELMPCSEEKEELQYNITAMQQMIVSYLDFSRGEEGEDFQLIDLSIWFKQFIQNEWSNNPEKQGDIILNCQTAFAKIKPYAFRRAMMNIIGNASKYASKVMISINNIPLLAPSSLANQHNINITIEDNGKGISDQEKKQVFKPFYREDKSRSLDSSASVGLGLAITKEIINDHHGSISLEDSKQMKGLLVRIILPTIKTNGH